MWWIFIRKSWLWIDRSMRKSYLVNVNHSDLTLSVMGYLTMIFSWGGLKDPQPKTGLNLVQSLCQSNHVTRSLSWPITRKMRGLALKMKKIWAFHFLRKSLNPSSLLRKSWEGKILKRPPPTTTTNSAAGIHRSFCSWKLAYIYQF